VVPAALSTPATAGLAILSRDAAPESRHQTTAPIERRERLGGLLNFYYRRVA
jgi:hypothetical protein